MGAAKQTSETTLPPASAGETNLIDLLRRFGAGGIGQLGDIGAIARGDQSAFQPNQQDRDLVGQNMGYTADIARRGIQDLYTQGSAQLDEDLSARGVSGASFEAVNKAIMNRDLQRQVADVMDRSRSEGNQALMNLPGQRAGLALNANQLLFQRILGGLQPALAGLQNPRMAQGKTTQTNTPGGLDYFNAALKLGSGIATGGKAPA